MGEEADFRLCCVVDSCSFVGSRRELIAHIRSTDDPAHAYASGIIDDETRA